jgi:hypothetical protein
MRCDHLRMLPTSESLQFFLLLQVCIQIRDRDAARMGLRRVATELAEAEGLQLTQLLSRSLDPQSRYWLANLLGERVRAVG